MISVYRTSDMEQAANLLGKNFRQVLVDAVYYCEPKIRIQADKLTTAQVYFDRTDSQVTRWQDSGGILIQWYRDRAKGEYEAMLFAECPRSIALLDRYADGARWIAVVYEPPTWRVHHDTVKLRMEERKPEKCRRSLIALERVQQLVESAPALTPASLARLLLSHPGQIARPSSVPVLPEVSVRVSDRVRLVP